MQYLALFSGMKGLLSILLLCIAGLAAQCLSSLRTTFQYGGRKNVPSKVEVEAVTVSICLKDCYSSYYMKDLPTF